jgi:hypothetical protein
MVVPEIECQEIMLMILGKKIIFSALLLLFASAALGQTGEVERVTVDELILMLSKKKPVTVIDVRNLDSYEQKIVGALQIPHDEIKSRLKEIPRNREIVTYCA